MDFKDWSQDIIRRAEEVKRTQRMELPQLIESEALRFVDDNFRNQAWEGQAWEPSKGTILVKSGALRRGFESTAIPEYVRITNEVKYAWGHNTGVDMEVTVPDHERGTYQTLGSGVFSKKGKEKMVKKKSGQIHVKGHKKHLKLPQRQFAPYEGHESKTLNKRVDVIIATTILKALNP